MYCPYYSTTTTIIQEPTLSRYLLKTKLDPVQVRHTLTTARNGTRDLLSVCFNSCEAVSTSVALCLQKNTAGNQC